LSGAVKIAFAGTPEFAVPVLERLCAGGALVDPVLTQPDRPAGRGRVPTASPVKHAAAARGLRIEQPERLADPSQLERLGPRPDLLVVVAYGLLLPQWALDWPRIAAVNLHASLLPRWRGASPIQQAILAGDAHTGVSLMRMTAGLDRGPVYAAAETPIEPRETAGALHDRLAVLGADLLAEALPDLVAGSLVPRPQNEAAACYARKIEKADAQLDWHAPAAVLARRVRAFNPWPVAESALSDGRRLRIHAAEPIDAESAEPPGTIVAMSPRGIDVATGAGTLRLERVQPPSGRVMDVAAYLAGQRLDGVTFVSR
jgi:methionyl-tRNA formyltransferase